MLVALQWKAKRPFRIATIVIGSAAGALIAIVGAVTAFNGGDYLPWVIAYFVITAAEIAYMSVLAFRYAKHPEQIRRREFQKRRHDALS